MTATRINHLFLFPLDKVLTQPDGLKLPRLGINFQSLSDLHPLHDDLLLIQPSN